MRPGDSPAPGQFGLLEKMIMSKYQLQIPPQYGERIQLFWCGRRTRGVKGSFRREWSVVTDLDYRAAREGSSKARYAFEFERFRHA
jgi:hypothetical protein